MAPILAVKRFPDGTEEVAHFLAYKTLGRILDPTMLDLTDLNQYPVHFCPTAS